MKQKEEIIELPFGAKDSELQEVTYHIPKGFHAEIDGDKITIKRNNNATVTTIVETGNGGINALVTKTLALKRSEEIEKEAQKFAFTMSEEDEVLKYEAFKAGAEWADAHPVHYDGKAMLYVLHKGVEQGRKEMLDRVIEWLDNDLCCYIGAQNFTIEHDRLNKDLRKDMEDKE